MGYPRGEARCTARVRAAYSPLFRPCGKLGVVSAGDGTEVDGGPRRPPVTEAPMNPRLD